jgi:hypothetical protein
MPDVKCKICKKKFYAKPSHLKRGWGKYCSAECQYKGMLKGKFVKCFVCGKEIWRTPKNFKNSKSDKFFCNKSCQTTWRNQYYSGPKHPNWQGGEHIEYRNLLLKSSVSRVCKICGTRDKRVLIVHHKDKKHRNHNVKNLVWLCLNCHFLVHKYNIAIN